MIRLSILQFRVQAITAVVALIAFAVLLAVTEAQLGSLYAASGLSGCHPASCGQLASGFLKQVNSSGAYGPVYTLSIILTAITPAVVGLFWGAPLLARELETGTFALAWSQSVTRARWLAVKLTVGALAAMAVTEALSLLLDWWAAPLGRAAGLAGGGSGLPLRQFNPLAFATHGVAPLGYAAFAFTLGVTSGALIRRTVPAMAVTLAIFAAVQIAMPLWIRPNLLPASHTTMAISGDAINNIMGTSAHPTFSLGGSIDSMDFGPAGLGGPQAAWILHIGAADTAGHPVSAVVPAACVRAATGYNTNISAVAGCLTSHDIREAVTYLPASRYWPLQWTETGIYLVLSVGLAGYCFRRLRRLS